MDVQEAGPNYGMYVVMQMTSRIFAPDAAVQVLKYTLYKMIWCMYCHFDTKGGVEQML